METDPSIKTQDDNASLPENFIVVCIKVAVFDESGSFLSLVLLKHLLGKGFVDFNKLLLSATFCHLLPHAATFFVESSSVLRVPSNDRVRIAIQKRIRPNVRLLREGLAMTRLGRMLQG